MNTLCRALRDSFLQQDLIVEGYMPKDEANEVADFLYWVVAGDTEVRYTSSSDVAGIAHCLINLGFEILTVEHFGAPSKCTSACQLVFSAAPFFSEKGKEIANERALIRRELSTTVSLTQPEETFSTFPISRKVANTCRMAWREGMKSAKGMQLALAHNQVRNNLDLIYELRNLTPVDDDNIVRIDAKIVKLVGTTLAFSQFQVAAILEGITSALGKESEETLDELTSWIVYKPEKVLPEEVNPTTVEAFHVFQAFAMGFYYEVFLSIVDTSTLAMKSVSGSWGYRSLEFLRKMRLFLMNGPADTRNPIPVIRLYRTDVLSILAVLFTNPDGEAMIPTSSKTQKIKQDLCIGFVAKRIILANSLVKNCKSIEEIGGYTLLDTDAGSIPRSQEGLVLPGTPNKFPTWEDHFPPAVRDDFQLCGPPEDFTRHIEPDWDGIPERVLLCIRYKGRRIGLLDPVMADIIFWRSWTEPVPEPIVTSVGLVHECQWDEFVVSGRLLHPGRGDPDIPVVVQSKNSPCMRYAAATWYSDCSEVAMINGCVHTALKHAQGLRHQHPAFRKYLVLVG